MESGSGEVGTGMSGGVTANLRDNRASIRATGLLGMVPRFQLLSISPVNMTSEGFVHNQSISRYLAMFSQC